MMTTTSATLKSPISGKDSTTPPSSSAANSKKDNSGSSGKGSSSKDKNSSNPADAGAGSASSKAILTATSASASSSANATSSNNEGSNVAPVDKYKRFEGMGVVFKAKLIGSELVMEPRGDKMCQNSIQRLKAIIKGTNSHKRRIVLKISYDGVKVYDEKTNEILHHHEVSQISFIASDDTDTRTFGYVSDVPNKAHQFICFKTSGPAANVMSVISELFEAVLERKNSGSDGKSTTSNKSSSLSTDQTSSKSGDAAASATTADLIQAQSIKHQLQLESIDLIGGDSGIMEGDSIIGGFSFGDETSSSQQQQQQQQQKLATSSNSAFGLQFANKNRSLVYNHSSVSLSDAALTRPSSFGGGGAGSVAAASPIRQLNSSADNSYVDRYAVFNDIDNLPSIFDSTSLGSVNNVGGNNDAGGSTNNMHNLFASSSSSNMNPMMMTSAGFGGIGGGASGGAFAMDPIHPSNSFGGASAMDPIHPSSSSGGAFAMDPIHPSSSFSGLSGAMLQRSSTLNSQQQQLRLQQQQLHQRQQQHQIQQLHYQASSSAAAAIPMRAVFGSVGAASGRLPSPPPLQQRQSTAPAASSGMLHSQVMFHHQQQQHPQQPSMTTTVQDPSLSSGIMFRQTNPFDDDFFN